MEIASAKRAEREKVIALWEGVPEVCRRARDAALLEALWPLCPASGSVFAYVGAGWEIDTRPFLIRCLKAGLSLGVPLCAKRGQMTVRQIFSLAELSPGHYGLPEPSADAPLLENPAFALIPGLAFSADCHRLGRGGGFYDRWLAKHPDTYTVGLCPDECLRELPLETHDMPLDCVLTPTRRFFSQRCPANGHDTLFL